MGREKKSICVGGSISFDLKQEFKTAIANAVSGSGIEVAIGGDNDGGGDKICPLNFNGIDSNNIVNRLSANGGIQIEQSEKARDDYGCEIAEAVANVIRPKLTV